MAVSRRNDSNSLSLPGWIVGRKTRMIMAFSSLACLRADLTRFGSVLQRLAWIALNNWIEDLVDLVHQIILEPDRSSCDVVVNLLGPRGPDDRARDIVVLEHPRNSELRHG